MKSTLNLRRVFISASILSLFIVEAFLWVQILSDIALRTGADFIAFYTAGRLAQTAGIANVYQPDRQRTIQQAQVGFELGETQVLLYNHLPFVIPLSMVAVDENFVASFMRWSAFMLIILCTATAWLAILYFICARRALNLKCPKCQHENPSDARFCNECGSKLETVCHSCGKTNPPGSKFCGECGHNFSLPSEPTRRELSFDEKLKKIQKYLPKGITEKILSQRDRIEGERKQVTVLFCDMEGFTSLI